MKILDSALAIKDQILTDRHNLHKNPEVSFYLPETVAYVQKRLGEMGIESHICGGPIDKKTRENFVSAGFPDMEASTGVVAVIGKGGNPVFYCARTWTPCLCRKLKGWWSSLQKSREKLTCAATIPTRPCFSALPNCSKTWKTSFAAPSSSCSRQVKNAAAGSRLMIEHGLLENPHVDAAFALHVMSNQDSGTLGYTPGIASAAMDTFMIKIKDKGGHTSTPQLCIDPLMIANQLYTTLNLLSCREIDPRETVALSVDECGGGTAVNIIPDTADVKVAARTFNREVTKHLVTRVPEITEHTVKMWRSDYDMINFHTPSTYNDENLCEELKPFLCEIMGEENVLKVPCMAGTEDFGYVGEAVPAMFATIGVGNKDAAPMHNPNMVVDEDMLPYGAALHASVAVNWLKNHKSKER